MSRIPRLLRLIWNLEQIIPRNAKAYMSQEEAYKQLKYLSGKDLGVNSLAWYDWYLKNHAGELELCSYFTIYEIKIKAWLYRFSKIFHK